MNYSKSTSDYNNKTEKFLIKVFFNHSLKEDEDYKKCPDFCDLEIAPVCGSDGETYPNKCLLKKKSCKSNSEIVMEHPGRCEIESKKNYDKSIEIYIETKFELIIF